MKQNLRYLGAFAVAALWLTLCVSAWFGGRTDISEAERRKLEQMPKITAEDLLSGKFMTHFETFTQDQFPLRDSFRQLKAIFSYRVLNKGDNNGIYLADGYAAKLEYPLNEASAQKAGEKFTKLYEQYLQDNSGKIVFTTAPDKGYYLARQNGYPAMDYEKLFDTMCALEWAEYVDITDCLTAQSYYTTDTHWRQETLLPAAQRIAEALGVQVDTDYRITELERPFYGVYYGQAALPMEPETVKLLENDTIDACYTVNAENGKTGRVYDTDKLTSRDLYDVFLSGPVSVITVENPNAKTERELVIFRDSFGSSLAPLLVSGYARVTLVDIRYVPTAYVGNFVDFHGQDVLFVYSPLVLNSSAMLK